MAGSAEVGAAGLPNFARKDPVTFRASREVQLELIDWRSGETGPSATVST